MPGRSRNALRVLLVTASEEELRMLGLPLHRDGVAVTRVRDVAGAEEALHAGGYDAAVVSHPLPDADVIGSCARLRQIPGAPPILLIDALDLNDQTIPSSIRPARLLRKPLDAAKLGAAIREVVEEPEASASAPDVAPLAFAAALLELARERETGVLEVRADAVKTRIFLRAGAPVSAEGGSLRETLGRMLLRRGALSEADYTRVIERMTEKLMANEHQRMGEVLVELGILSGEEVRQALQAQVLEKIDACFQWARPTWSFSELDVLPEGLEPFALPPIEAQVWAGLRGSVPAEALAAWLAPHALLRPRLKRTSVALHELLRLEASELRLLERIDGKRSLAALQREAAEAAPLLATLLLLDALELTGGSEPSGTAPREPRRAVRVPFAREVVGRRKAPAAAASEGAAATGASEPAKARLEAEQAFRRAQQLLASEKPLEAVKLLRRAMELEPGEPEYAMVEAWASYLESRHNVRVARAKAVACARRLLDADPKAPKVHTVLGRLALDEGDRVRAAREFELALLRDPEDEEAKRGLKQVRA